MIRDLTKIFGIVFSFIGLFLDGINCLLKLNNFKPMYNCNVSFIVILSSIILFLSAFFIIGRYIQVAILCIAATGSMIHFPETGFGFILLILIILISEKYGLFNRDVLFKSTILFISSLAVFIFSFKYNKVSVSRTIIAIFLYFIFALSILIFKFEGLRIKFDQDSSKGRFIKELKGALYLTHLTFKTVDANHLSEMINGLTKTEIDLLKNLCFYKEGNRALARRMNKSANTIKVQINNIFNKLGVNNRHQLIELFGSYFLSSNYEES